MRRPISPLSWGLFKYMQYVQFELMFHSDGESSPEWHQATEEAEISLAQGSRPQVSQELEIRQEAQQMINSDRVPRELKTINKIYL